MKNKSRLPRFKRAKSPPPIKINDLVRQILHAVYVYRMLTREQIEWLIFPPVHGQDHLTRTTEVRLYLKLLFHNGYLDRVPMPTEIGKWAWLPVYRLAPKGAERVASELQIDKKELVYWGRGDHKDKRPADITRLFLVHALRVNDVRIAITRAVQQSGFKMEKWLDDGQLKSQAYKEYVSVREEQEIRRVAVIPDAYFILNYGDRRAHFFLELDRATMTSSRWVTRVKAYLEYVRSGQYTKRYQTTSLRILTVTTTEERLRNLKKATEKAGGPKFFWFTTLDQVTASSVLLRPIWLLANDERGDVVSSFPEGKQGETSNRRARKALVGDPDQ